MRGDFWGRPYRRWAPWGGPLPRLQTYRLLLVIGLLALAGWVAGVLPW